MPKSVFSIPRMFLGGAEEIAIEGEACEKSKPRVLSIAVYCIIAVVAHFVAQDVRKNSSRSNTNELAGSNIVDPDRRMYSFKSFG